AYCDVIVSCQFKHLYRNETKNIKNDQKKSKIVIKKQTTGTQKNKIILLNTHNNEKCAEQVGFVQQGFHCLCLRTQRKPWCCAIALFESYF
ncbi:MAG: hypothetical protein FWH18_12815, partial [Marinilabiliaceae bacterium]|nr:hypothetical protein [Marinilabiliaceae bacterium]